MRLGYPQIQRPELPQSGRRIWSFQAAGDIEHVTEQSAAAIGHGHGKSRNGPRGQNSLSNLKEAHVRIVPAGVTASDTSKAPARGDRDAIAEGAGQFSRLMPSRATGRKNINRVVPCGAPAA